MSRSRSYEAVKRWRLLHREEHSLSCKKYNDAHPDRNKGKQSRTEQQIKVHNWTYRNKLPLGPECEFCGSTENLVHHHPDYEYPQIFVTACVGCNIAIDKNPITEGKK